MQICGEIYRKITICNISKSRYHISFALYIDILKCVQKLSLLFLFYLRLLAPTPAHTLSNINDHPILYCILPLKIVTGQQNS